MVNDNLYSLKIMDPPCILGKFITIIVINPNHDDKGKRSLLIELLTSLKKNHNKSSFILSK